MCCLHFREYIDKIRQKKIRTYDEIGGLFYQKKLHNTVNSTLNHKNVDSVDPEESYIHTYTFKFKIGIFFCQKPIMFFCSLSLKKRKFDIPIFLALRFKTIYYVISEETKSIDY